MILRLWLPCKHICTVTQTLAGFTKRQQRPKPKTMLAKVWNPQSTVQEDEDEFSRMEAMPLKGIYVSGCNFEFATQNLIVYSFTNNSLVRTYKSV